MKRISKLLVIVTALLLSQITFAAKDNVTVNFNLINMTFSAGDGFIYDDNFQYTLSPLIAKNGGTLQWAPSLSDSLFGLGMSYPNGVQNACYQGSEAMVINPEIYKGDVITITYKQDSSGNLVCSCTGSACDISVKKH